MNYKVDESMLMAYLYGELSAEEQGYVKQYLKENPQSQVLMEEMNKVRTLLGKLEDQEPTAPLIMQTDERPPLMRRLVPWLSAAAAACILLMIGYVTDFTLSLKPQQLTLSFGEVENSPSITEEQLVPLMADLLNQQNTQYHDQLQNVKSSLESQIALNQQQIAKTKTRPAPPLNEAALQAFLAQQQSQNMQQMAQLLEDNTQVQREELQVFLAEYHQYLEERRLQDLQLIEAGFQAVQDNVDQQKSETEQILANIITSVNSTNY